MATEHILQAAKASDSRQQSIIKEAKTSAQRIKEYRDRKKLLRAIEISDDGQPSIKEVKTPAQRSKDYRDRKKLLRTTKISSDGQQSIIKKAKTPAQRNKEYRDRKKLLRISEISDDGQPSIIKKVKTAAQRNKEYRDRKKLLRTSEISDDGQPSINKVKTSAQRSKEYRDRKKLLGTSEISSDGQQQRSSKYTREDLEKATKLVFHDGWSQNQASKFVGLPATALCRYLRKLKLKTGTAVEDVSTHRGRIRTLFSAELESLLVDYIQYRTEIGRRLTSSDIKEVVYRIALSNNIENLPPSWNKNKMADTMWFVGFRERHPSIKVRRVGDSAGSGPAMSFDEYNFSVFFENLKQVYKNYPSIVERARIYNLDEIALMTIRQPVSSLDCNKPSKSIEVNDQNTSVFVTACCIVRANGTFLPPAMIFPKDECEPNLIEDAPVGTLGLAHSTGQLTTKFFLDVMKHFVEYSNSSMEDPTLMIYDNDESHLVTNIILNFARENGVVLLKLPPHCSNNFQPSVSLFELLKKSYDSAIYYDHQLKNPGNTISIDDVGRIFKEAFLEVMTPSNITAGFMATGIYEFNRDIFKDENFSKSSVTDETEASTFINGATLTSASAIKTEFELSETESTASICSNEPEMILGYP